MEEVLGRKLNGEVHVGVEEWSWARVFLTRT